MSACLRGQPDNSECPDTTGLHKGSLSPQVRSGLLFEMSKEKQRKKPKANVRKTHSCLLALPSCLLPLLPCYIHPQSSNPLDRGNK
ncbi:hypothetical protein PRUPE_4G028500 [Prunus persica]|uniref:Uncharacterized protein n=1 Tax=Prunus persica TaxID=3760 RepID=A0A251PEV1_PRUPE|nr:hypothetical protein PRUPE_4G028500 [Prunus persica]